MENLYGFLVFYALPVLLIFRLTALRDYYYTKYRDLKGTKERNLYYIGNHISSDVYISAFISFVNLVCCVIFFLFI